MSASPRLSIPAVAQKKAPELVGPYILGRTLGRGTTGKVKAAQHKDTGLEVAIKIVKKAYVKTHKNKIAREIAVMRLLDHPYILKLYDVLETSQHIFIVMERVKGGELFDYILQKGRLPRQEALRLMAQIIQGVEFCHMHSICHRDIKPENLLLDENLNIKIADFGMAQLSPDGAALDTFCGSPHYGAPEVVSGIRYDGRRSDLWSLGVVFYALITGMLPFDNPNVSVLLKMVKRGVYHMPKFVPDDIADLIRRMLTVDVEQRIRTHELKYHRCFLGPNGNNLYFPPNPTPSPALEMMRTHPLKNREDLDPNILRDLEGLGWGNSDQLAVKILEKREDSNYNLETIFYQLLAARNSKRGPESPSPMYEEPESPVASPNYYPSPNSPPYSSGPYSQYVNTSPVASGVGRRASVTASPPAHKMETARSLSEAISPKKDEPMMKAIVENDKEQVKPPTEEVTESTADAVGLDDEKKGKAKRKPLTIAITPKVQPVVEASASGKKEYSTTPRFHRMKMVSSPDDSPGVPITPTAKRSWFKSLFRRRPSVDIVGKEHQHQGASGMYSEKQPADLLKEVSRVLNQMGIALKVGSSSDYELKCEAMCFLDNKFQLHVLDKANNVVYKSEDVKEAIQEEENELGEQEAAQAEKEGTASVRDRMKEMSVKDTPASPKLPPVHPDMTKPQVLKFSVDIAREDNDQVSCVNFNHRQGDLLIYRGLYTDIIKQLHM